MHRALYQKCSMSANPNYGVMCFVSPSPFATEVDNQKKASISWFSKHRLICLITHRETTIGRSLSSDIVLLDLMVSRVHARLVLDDQGWSIFNETTQILSMLMDAWFPEAHVSVFNQEIRLSLALQPCNSLLLNPFRHPILWSLHPHFFSLLYELKSRNGKKRKKEFLEQKEQHNFHSSHILKCAVVG